MKSKKFVTFIFITLGLFGLILFIFGLQFNGTLTDEIQKIGLFGMSVCAVWGIFNIVDAYIKQKELENL